MAGHALSFSSLLARPALTLRAALGGLLVTLALLGVSQAYAHADRPPSTSYVVAARPLAPGAILASSDLDLVPADLPSTVASRAFTATAVLDGAVILAPLAPGEPLLLSQVLPAGTSPAEGADLSFAITTDRALGGSIRAGERVDLIATLPGGDTSQVADGAVVIETRTETDGLLTETGRLLLTVRLQAQAEVLGLVEAVDEGQLTVVRSPVGTAT
ncbi:MAG TPA: SAF domain-containing protein [Acidimicrobiales bacterium]